MPDSRPSRDIAFLLPNGVMVGLIVLLVGAIATIFVLTTRATPQVLGSEAAVAASEPDVAAVPTDAETAAGPDTAAGTGANSRPPQRQDDAPVADGPAATGPVIGRSEGEAANVTPPSPDARPTGSPSTAGDRAGATTALPDRDGGRGLFSADDPDRLVAITPITEPLHERVIMADLDGDGREERIWAAVVANQVHVRVERVVGGVWTPVSERVGAVADRLVNLWAADLNDDGRREVATRQWVGTQGESITLWTYDDEELRRMPVFGGCADGSNTIGLVGALAQVPGEERPTLAAVCREPGLPPHQWPSALYEWRDGRWAFARFQGRVE